MSPRRQHEIREIPEIPDNNEPASTPFQALMNGMRLALVNVQGGRNFGFGGEAMPMSFLIKRLDSEAIAIV